MYIPYTIGEGNLSVSGVAGANEISAESLRRVCSNEVGAGSALIASGVGSCIEFAGTGNVSLIRLGANGTGGNVCGVRRVGDCRDRLGEFVHNFGNISAGCLGGCLI